MANGANRNVIETEEFKDCCKSGSRWLVEDGMAHGFGFRNLRIDGNRDNNTRGHGLAIYGKRYLIDGVMIVNCAEDGLYSQGPDIGGQKETDDILEAEIRSIRIHKCGRNGITYRGPHDGYIASAFIGECDNIGLQTDPKSGHYNGAVDVGRIHSYACRIGIHIKTAGTALQRVLADTNFMQGLIVDEHRVQVGQLWAFRNWRTDKGAEKRSEGTEFIEDASVELNQACQIGTATVRTDFGGTGIRIRGSRTQIGTCQIENTNPRGQIETGIGIDIQASLVRVSGDVRGFSVPGSVGVRVTGEKPLMLTNVNCTIVDCATGFVNASYGDSRSWSIQIQTTAGQVGFENRGETGRSNIYLMSRGKDFRTLCKPPL
jgi:hypothetical protein